MDDVYLIRGETLSDIADAIRDKTGGTDEIAAGDFAEEIGEIETGGGLPEKGLVFEDYDSDGYPHSARFVGTWTEIPENFCISLFSGDSKGGYPGSFGKYITHIVIPDTVTKINSQAFNMCYALESIEFPDNDLVFVGGVFRNTNSIKEFVFKRNVDSIDAHTFASSGLKRVVFGGDINMINSFTTCSGNELYDFSHCTFIPPLYSVASLAHASGCVIRIPAALSDTTLGEGNGWESETNWCDLTAIVWEVV